MPLQQFDERVPEVIAKALDDTVLTTDWSELTGQGSGTLRFDTISICNLDTIDHNLTFSYHAAIAKLIGVVTVPAGAGVGTVPPFDLLAAILPASFHYLYLGAEYNPSLYVQIGEVINTGKYVVITAMGGYF